MLKKKIAAIIVSSLLLILVRFVFGVAVGIRRVSLLTGIGYPLADDYRYVVFSSGRHQLIRAEGTDREKTLELGYHVNRLYFDDRYIAGEITQEPENEDQVDNYQYLFFIVDTESDIYYSQLTEARFYARLEKLGIDETVELIGRDSREWLKKQ